MESREALRYTLSFFFFLFFSLGSRERAAEPVPERRGAGSALGPRLLPPQPVYRPGLCRRRVEQPLPEAGQ